MKWKDSKMVSAEIVNPQGGDAIIRNGDQTVKVSIEAGKTFAFVVGK
jgi:hypothetical protein